MIGWLLDLVPWWVYAGIGAAAVLVVWRVFGLKPALAAIAAVVAAAAYRKGRDEGARTERAKRERIDAKAVRERDEVEDAVAGRTPEENRRRLWKKP